jgi:hypothetical protein
MHPISKGITTLTMASVLFTMTGCENMGALAPALDGISRIGIPGVDPRTQHAISQGLRLTAVAIRVAESYRVSAQQRQIAEARARNHLSNSSVKGKMKASHVSKVGVRVPAKDGNPAGIAITDENGNATGKAYVPKAGEKLEKGKVYDLGGNKVSMADSWQGV